MNDMGLARWPMFFDLMARYDPQTILEVTPRGRELILKPVIDETNKHIVEMKMSDKSSGKKKRGGGNRGGGYGARGGGYGARGGGYSGYNSGLYRQNNHQYSSQKPVIGQMVPAPNPKKSKVPQYSSPAYGGSNLPKSTGKKSPSKGYQVGGSAKFIPPGAVLAQSPQQAKPVIQPGPVTGAYRQPSTQAKGPVKVFISFIVS